MDTQTIVLILVVAVVIVLAGLFAWFSYRLRRSQHLRQKFGPEYDYTLQKEGDKHTAEETLKEREKRVTRLDIRTLENSERDRYQAEWMLIQADFVDNPSKSVEEADRLITEVMNARGFPVSDFEQRAADLSVLYPDFVTNYRNAYAITLKNKNNEASTEDLRQATVYFRSLFEELLGIVEVKSTEKEVATR